MTTGSVSGEPHAERVAHYRRAAEEAVMAHPLPGEDLATTYLEDAQMWVTVYRELLTFKEALIRDTNQALATLPPVAREEVATTDAVIIHAEAERFRDRLSRWEARCAELSG